MKNRLSVDPMSMRAAEAFAQLQKAAQELSLVTVMSYETAFTRLMWAVTTSTMTIEEAKVEVEKAARALAALGK